MRVLRWHRWWLIAGWVWLALVLYLSLTPKPPTPELGLLSWDKFNHFAAYAWLMGWFAQIYHRPAWRIGMALGFVCLGIGLEFLQGMGEARYFEYGDMLANGLGVIGAYLITIGPGRRIFQGLEHMLGQGNRA